MISWRFVRIRMSRISSWKSHLSGDVGDGTTEQNTYTLIHLSADFLQRTLDTLDHLSYRRSVLLSMFTLEYDARVSDYADGLAPGKEEIAEHRSVRGEECKRLFEFWGW